MDHFSIFIFLLLLFTVLYTALNPYKSQTCNKRKKIPLPPEVDLALFRPVLTLGKEEKTKTAVSRPVTLKKKSKLMQLLHSTPIMKTCYRLIVINGLETKTEE